MLGPPCAGRAYQSITAMIAGSRSRDGGPGAGESVASACIVFSCSGLLLLLRLENAEDSTWKTV